VMHPVEVASLLEPEGCPDHVVAAAVRHDCWRTPMSSGLSWRDASVRGSATWLRLSATIRRSRTMRPARNELRERVRRIGGYALAVYAADKVSKVRELRYLLTVGLSPDEAEIKHRRHRKSLRMLDDELGETRLVERLRFELEALEALPPRGRAPG
jgi:hypothetical protein